MAVDQMYADVLRDLNAARAEVASLTTERDRLRGELDDAQALLVEEQRGHEATRAGLGGEVREERRHLPMYRTVDPCRGPDLHCTVPAHHEVRTLHVGSWRPAAVDALGAPTPSEEGGSDG